MPNSPPDAPTTTRCFTTRGATGVVSPCERSAILVFHSSLPVAAATATVCPSSRLYTILPSEEGAAIDGVAAGDAKGIGIHRGTVLPFQGIALPREVEGIEDVRVGGDDVHRMVDDERLPLVPAQHAGREAPHGAQAAGVGSRYLGQVAVAGGRVVLGRHGPVAALRGAASRQNREQDRKSTRLNSSHRCISYAVFCLKKKITRTQT